MKKKILTALGITAALSLSIGGSLALMASEASNNNILKNKNVQIVQLEYQRVNDTDLEQFSQNKVIIPNTSTDKQDVFKWSTDNELKDVIVNPDAVGTLYDNETNAVDKIVFVKNEGSTSVYYRTIIAVETPEGAENAIAINRNVVTDEIKWKEVKGYFNHQGTRYKMYVATYLNTLESGKVSLPSLLQVYMTKATTNDIASKFGDEVNVLVVSQAVQSSGFEGKTAAEVLDEEIYEVTAQINPWVETVIVHNEEELQTAVAAGKNVKLANDILLTAKELQDGEGDIAPIVYIKKNVDIDLNGKTISVIPETYAGGIVMPIYVTDGAKLTIGNGTISTEMVYNGKVQTCYAIGVDNKGTVEINSGTYYGQPEAVVVYEGTLIVNGGHFELTPSAKEIDKTDSTDYRQYIIHSQGTHWEEGLSHIEIKGGTFVGTNPSENTVQSPGNTISYVFEGYKVIDNEDGTYTVVPQ